MQSNKVVLIIMDGWGIPKDISVSAIDAAKTPFYRHCLDSHPHSHLRASEKWVGLPMGQMGNSEVGHMNIGAGRIVYQDLQKISQFIEDKNILNIPAFQNIINYCEENDKALHLLGLVSDGGVHSHIDHLKGLISLLAEQKRDNVYIHLFTDGRDTDPESGKEFIKDLQQHLKKEKCGKIASICGRYYAMDRNKKWGRIRKAYDLLINGTGKPFEDPLAAFDHFYGEGITDEFIPPVVITQNGKPLATLDDNDAVLFFNFRTDRGRQLTEALTQGDLKEYNLHKIPLHYTTMTRYDESYTDINVVFEKENIQKSLGEILSKQGKKQIRIAETEKYPHVTFFFNGGREVPFPGEKRILIPSPNVATYDLQPEMSANEIKVAIEKELNSGEVDFVCLNFANPDMVGHTGVFDAVIKACETVDTCTKSVVNTALKNDYSIIIIADHGNADKMKNMDGSPHTAHTTSLVPCILIRNEEDFDLKDGKLGDIAPTILELMGISQPEEMTGDSLLIKK